MQTNYQECTLSTLHIPIVGLYRYPQPSLLCHHGLAFSFQTLGPLTRPASHKGVEQSSKIKSTNDNGGALTKEVISTRVIQSLSVGCIFQSHHRGDDADRRVETRRLADGQIGER